MVLACHPPRRGTGGDIGAPKCRYAPRHRCSASLQLAFSGGEQPMPINCGYCGRTHPTAKEARDCWEDHGRPKYSRSSRKKGGPTRTVPPPAAPAPAAEEDAPPPPPPPAPVAPSPAKPKRKVAPSPAKPKKSSTEKCFSCGFAISVNGKCRCS